MSTTPLSDTLEVVQRSIYHAIRKEVVDKGYYPDTSALISDTIIAVDSTAKTFDIATNRTTYYVAGRKFTVKLSALNNGTYTVVSATWVVPTLPDTPYFRITVTEAIPDDNVVDGKTSIYKYYDDDAGIALLKTDIASIITSKGYVIEVFGVSAPYKKYQKKVPRIVIVKNQFLPGALGGAPDRIYTLNSNEKFDAKVMPPQTVDFNFDVRLVSSSAAQSRVLQGILALSVPKRGYIALYTDEETKFFVEQYSYRSIPDSEDNIDEDVYMYSAKDIFESENATVATDMAPMTEITVERYIDGDDEDDSIEFDPIIEETDD